MKMNRYVLVHGCFALLLLMSVQGQATMKKIAQSKMLFIKISPSARAAALGDAFTSYAGDPNAIFYNPAGIAFVNNTNFTFNNSTWIADIHHLSAALSHTTKRLGTFSISFINMDYGDFQRTIVDEHAWDGYKVMDSFSIMEYAVGVGYANKITNRLSLGGQVKYLYQNLGPLESFAYIGTEFAEKTVSTYKDIVMAFDFGTYYNTELKGIVISMAMQNFSNQPLPLVFRYGMSIELSQIFQLPDDQHRLNLSGDILQSKDYGDGYQFGLEYGLQKQYFLRTGYKINTATEEDFSFGLGTRLSLKRLKFQIDYSYSKFGVLENISRLSIGFEY